MRIVDDTGRLFGRVNVYDALVVLAVLGVVGVGVVFVVPTGGDAGEPATRYATVDLGEQSPAVAGRVSAGDVADVESSSDALTITDTYVGPADGGNVSVVVRVRVDGTLGEPDRRGERVFEFADAPLRRGDELDVDASGYEVGGEVLELDTENRSLEMGRLPVLVETRLSPATAALVDRGDASRIDGRSVATVTGAVSRPTVNRTDGTALVGLSLRTVEYSGNSYYGDTRVLAGRNVAFSTERYAFSGSVVRWGNASLPGDPTDRTAVVKLANVRPEVVDGLEVGMVERRGGTPVAEVTAVRTEPASVVLTSDDGDIYERDHPRNRDVYLTVDLRVRRTEDGLRFRSRRLRAGSDVVLDFRTVVVEGTVTNVGR